MLDKVKLFAEKTLICAEDSLKNKNDLLKKISEVKSVDEYRLLIHKADTVNETVKECLLEIL